jgi:acyl carrier protein
MGAELARSANDRQLKIIEPAAAWIALESLLTSSLPQAIADPNPPPLEPARRVDLSAPRESATDRVIGIVAEILEASASELDPQASFVELGIDSILAIQLTRRLESAFGLALRPTLPFDYPSIERLAGFLASQKPASSPAPSNGTTSTGNGHPTAAIATLASGRRIVRIQSPSRKPASGG